MKKVMVSQPMGNISDEIIKETKSRATKSLMKNGYIVVNTLFNEETLPTPEGVTKRPLFCLAKSLEIMAGCDAIYFYDGWEKARGCQIEHDVAEQYGLEIIYESGPVKKESERKRKIRITQEKIGRTLDRALQEDEETIDVELFKMVPELSDCYLKTIY